MTDKPLVHPEKDQLLAFGLGKLELSEATEIETHLKECSNCCETLLNLKDDTFVALVREAGGRSEVFGKSPGGGADHRADNQFNPAATVLLPSAEPDSAADLPGELADHPRYRVIELIGKGGMGVVYKAEHRLMNRTVALKVINPKLVQNAEAVQRFRREVQAAAQLTHLNIVTAYDAEQAGTVHYLVMEYVDGTDLSEIVREHGPLPVALACDYIRQAADGLQHAHERGMVHRDIKPHNLMVTSGGQIKILDFGLSTLVRDAESMVGLCTADRMEGDVTFDSAALPASLTAAGAMMGTPDFISPEQAGDAHSVDIRSDIYSLGCTFYLLLTGRPPFEHDSAVEKLKAHADAEPESLETVRAEVPADVAQVVRRTMAKKPADRFQTPAEVADALAPFAQRSSDKHQFAGSAAQPKSTARKRFPPARPLIAMGLAAVMMLAASVFFVELGRTTIRFDIEDPNLAVSFGDAAVTVDNDGQRFTVTPGTKHRFVVEQNGVEVETDSITLKKGQKVALRVTLVDDRVHVVPSDPTVGVVKSRKASPTPSVSSALPETRKEFMAFVQAVREAKTDKQQQRALAQHAPVLSELGIEANRELLRFLDRLPDEDYETLLNDGYLKWQFRLLDKKSQAVFETILAKLLSSANKMGFAPADTSDLLVKMLQKADVGFAVLNVSDRQLVVLWNLVPESPLPIMLPLSRAGESVVVKAMKSRSIYDQILALREKADSPLPPDAAFDTAMHRKTRMRGLDSALNALRTKTPEERVLHVALWESEGKAAVRFANWNLVFEGVDCSPRLIRFGTVRIPTEEADDEGPRPVTFSNEDSALIPTISINEEIKGGTNTVSVNSFRFQFTGRADTLMFTEQSYAATPKVQTMIISADGAIRPAKDTPRSVKH